jgi:putative spermidine/putrescine transport system permease protein
MSADAGAAGTRQWKPHALERLARRVLGRWGFAVLAAPALIFLGLVFFQGLYRLFEAAFQLDAGGPSLSIFSELLGSKFFRSALWRTMYLSAITTVGAIVISYPLAYFVARSRPERRTLYLFLILLPWLSSIVLRSFGWRIMLSDKGLINGVLMELGIIDQPLQLVFNSFGIVVGLVHVLSPFMMLTLLSVFMSLDRRLEEGAAMLGANPIQTFLRVVLPLTRPGLITGSILVFLLAVATVVTPQILGGIQDRTLAMLMYDQMLKLYDFQTGAAMAVILVAFAVPVAMLMQAFERRRRSSR